MEPTSNRAIFAADLENLDQALTAIRSRGGNFICLTLMDADDVLGAFPDAFWRSLVHAGLCYYCAWGQNCEAAHDLCDEYLTNPAEQSELTDTTRIITTWHSNESMQDAIRFAIYTAQPDKEYIESCNSVLILGYEKQNYLRTTRRLLSDLDVFNSSMLS